MHAVVVRSRRPRSTGEELTAFCRGRIASYKTPAVDGVVDALPLSAAGKVLKRELREAALG